MDEAIEISLHKPASVVVFQRPQCRATLKSAASKDYDWKDLVEKVTREGKNIVPCEEMKSTDALYLLYTSGTTGKPKGISLPSINTRDRSRVRWKCSPTRLLNEIHLQRQTNRDNLLCKRYWMGTPFTKLIHIGRRTHLHHLCTSPEWIHVNLVRG